MLGISAGITHKGGKRNGGPIIKPRSRATESPQEAKLDVGGKYSCPIMTYSSLYAGNKVIQSLLDEFRIQGDVEILVSNLITKIFRVSTYQMVGLSTVSNRVYGGS